MGGMPNKKAVAVAREIVDPRGRYWRDNEFKWLMDYFSDRYDPRRLSLALCHCAGLRLHDGVHAKMSDFNEDFSYVRMKQCKPHIKAKDKILRITIKSRLMPLPDWLSADLRAYVKYRLLLYHYAKVVPNDRMFPSVCNNNIYDLFYKLRKKFGNKQTFLKEVWYYEHRLYEDGTEYTIPKYRFAPHAGRAMFSVTATKVCDGSVSDARCLTGHERIKEIERYTRYANIEDKKDMMVTKYFSQLNKEIPIPISKDQKKLKEFIPKI